jgi:hypothetical protein
MRITVAWLRIDLRRRWRSLLVLALLVAVSTGTVLTAVAGARRGASAVDRLWAADTLPATAAVLPNQRDFDWTAVAAFPEVAAVAQFCGTLFLDGITSDDVPFPPCDRALMSTTERLVLHEGRAPDPSRADEAVVSPRFVKTYGKGVGDTVTGRLPSLEQIAAVDRGEPEPDHGEGPGFALRIVGVGVSPWLRDRPMDTGGLAPSSGLAAKFPEHVMADRANALVRLSDGEAGLRAFQARLNRLAGRTIDVWNLPEQARQDQQTTAFEARSLIAIAAAALLAALFLLGQAIVRYVTGGVSDLESLRAAGMAPRQVVAAVALPPTMAALAGGGVGVLAATVASRWFPIGTAAAFEPYPGIRPDAAVLGTGWVVALLLVLGVAATTAALAIRRDRRPQPGARSAVAAAVAGAGAPVPVLLGTRFALERGQGRTAVPVRPALLGAVVGVLGVVGALTFASAIADAAENPRRFGQTHALESWFGFDGADFLPSHDVLRAVAGVDGVTGTNDTRFGVAEVPGGGRPVTLHSYDPVGAPLDVVLSSGRLPAKDTEVVLAPESATALGVNAGDLVTLTDANGRPARLTVTGTGFVPISFHNGYATGGWLTGDGYRRMFGAPVPGPQGTVTKDKGHVGLVSLADGVDTGTAAARIRQVLGQAGGDVAGAQFAASEPPPELAELRQVRELPAALGIFLAVLAMAAVGHALATAVRRRRHDVAVLRALGMTRWQSRGVVVTQATVLALVGLAFGVPLGIALGRTVWRVVADYTPLHYVPPLAFWALVLVGPLALLVANLLAAWPGHQAARLRIGHVLRAE